MQVHPRKKKSLQKVSKRILTWEKGRIFEQTVKLSEIHNENAENFIVSKNRIHKSTTKSQTSENAGALQTTPGSGKPDITRSRSLELNISNSWTTAIRSALIQAAVFYLLFLVMFSTFLRIDENGGAPKDQEQLKNECCIFHTLEMSENRKEIHLSFCGNTCTKVLMKTKAQITFDDVGYTRCTSKNSSNERKGARKWRALQCDELSQDYRDYITHIEDNRRREINA